LFGVSTGASLTLIFILYEGLYSVHFMFWGKVRIS